MEAMSLWFESALLPQGWTARVRIDVHEGRIKRIEAGVAAEPTDERHALALPGMPNLHSHAFQRGLAGLTERRGASADSFWSWRELMYRFVERMDPEGLEAISALAYAEMLEAGFTHVGEFHYLHHDRGGVPFADPGELAARIVAAAAHTGIGLTLLPVFYAHGGFGAAAPAPRQRRFINDPPRFARILEASRVAVRALPGACVGVAPHSLRAVTGEELAEVLALAPDAPVHIHIAEQLREVEDCLQWSGRRPIEWLIENAAVDARWCLVHATHATAAELQAIAARHAVVGLCPMTEASLGDGIFPALAFAEYRGNYGIGSDSNIRLDAAEELRLLEYSQRLAHRARNVLASAGGASTGRSLFEAALVGGARALHGPQAPAAAAGLREGASLDLVTLRKDDPSLIGRQGDEILDSWIFCGGRAAIDCVWRAGVKLVTNGAHRERDAIVARYASALRRLLA
jgi:formimidoylglutamate deiminase